jgi:hypothetical protein
MATQVTQAILALLAAKEIREMTVPKVRPERLAQAVELQSLLCQPKHHQQNKFAIGITPQTLGESHELRNHTVDYFDLDIGRRTSKLAAQQELGLWTQWRYWANRAHHCGVVGDGTDLTFITSCNMQIGELCVG